MTDNQRRFFGEIQSVMDVPVLLMRVYPEASTADADRWWGEV